AFPADELAKAVILLAGLTPSPQEFQEAKLQKPKLERGHALVLHELRCAKSRNLAADLGCRPEPAGAAGPVEILDAFHIQVNEVLIKNRIGKIGAGIKWPPVMDRVQRIERDETGLAVLNRPIDYAAKIPQVSAAPVDRRSHPVESDRDACRAALAF